MHHGLILLEMENYEFVRSKVKETLEDILQLKVNLREGDPRVISIFRDIEGRTDVPDDEIRRHVERYFFEY